MLQEASDRLKNDKDFVLKLVKRNGCELYGASNKLRNDKEIVLEACKQDKNAFNYAGDKIKEQYSTVESLLNSQKEMSSKFWNKEIDLVISNFVSKENDLDKPNAWNDKVNSGKSNDFER